jgi:uncharacterized protein YecE (DUF72 family)
VNAILRLLFYKRLTSHHCPIIFVKKIHLDFGRLPSIDHVDFTLPADFAGNKILLNSKSQNVPFNLFVGCPVWGEKEWLGTIYPKNAKEKDLLSYYSRQFNCIELNTTYYRIPLLSTVTGWKNSTPDNFSFCPKIPKEISHTRQLSNTRDLTLAFCEVMQQLENKLGTFFLQLPPWFEPDRANMLKQFILEFPPHLKLAVEFRNEKWFTEKVQLEELFSFFEEREIGTVLTDTAGRRDVLHMRLTTTTAFIRFTANDLHPTDFPRMDSWAERLKVWKAEGVETIYFFVHSPTHGQMPRLVNYAVKKMNEVLGTSLEPCRFIEEQQTLFG